MVAQGLDVVKGLAIIDLCSLVDRPRSLCLGRCKHCDRSQGHKGLFFITGASGSLAKRFVLSFGFRYTGGYASPCSSPGLDRSSLPCQTIREIPPILMAKLENLNPGAMIKGILPGQHVTLISVQEPIWHPPNFSSITHR